MIELPLQAITILGSTGSVGLSTLDVIGRHPNRFSIHGLTANTQVDLMAEQCLQYRPRFAAMRDEGAAQRLKTLLSGQCATEVLAGEEGVSALASATEVDTVMAAIVGAAGLSPTLAAVRSGKKVLLANKEALVMAGQLFINAVRDHGAT